MPERKRPMLTMSVAVEGPKGSLAEVPLDLGIEDVLFLRGKHGWRLQLRLRNAMEDFLLLDRDEKPVRLDPRLLDPEFAGKKLGEVVESRLAMVRALNESRKVGEVADKIQKLGGKHGTFRIWEFEDGAGGKR